jgi:signal transduction histidine kinase
MLGQVLTNLIGNAVKLPVMGVQVSAKKLIARW